MIAKYAAIYYLVACGLSWILWAPLFLGQDGLKWLPIAPFPPVVICIGTLGPLLACYIVHRLRTGNWRAVRLLPSKSRIVWLLLGPLLILFCLFVLFPALISKGAPTDWHWHFGALAGIWIPMLNYNLFGGPLFEEFGWRGFLQSQLQQILPPWLAAVCVGVMWAIWHFPLFLTGWSSAPPAVFVSIMVGLSVVMAFAFNASGCAVVVAILMHSAFNASSPFIAGFLRNVPTRDHPSAETLIAFSFLLAATATVLATGGRLSRYTRN